MRKNFLISSWLFGFGNSISSPLVSLYIYVTSSTFYALKFILFNSLFILMSYFIAGYILSIKTKVLSLYKIGISLYITFYLLLALLNVNSYKLVDLISVIYGFAQGFYWFGWDVIFYNTPRKMEFFNKSSYLGYLTTLLAPAIYGIVLSIFHNTGYIILFILSSLILLTVILLVEDIKVNVKLNLKKSFSVITRNENYKYTMVALALVAGYNYVVGNLNPILMYKIFSGNYTFFSITNYILGLISLLSVYFIRGKIINKVRHNYVVLFSSLLLVVATFFILLYPLVYLIFYSFFSPLIYPIIDVHNWNNIERNLLLPYLINRQIFLNISRIMASLMDIYVVNVDTGIIILIPLLITASVIFYSWRMKV
ncbi:hypothetical protein [Sulfurisphaera ohwakuensis]|uniref:YQGE family putative transporter n=1 Tax=Sulfurisphaera ohwakuensis TaxID=69656 RepID=A0A650CKB2_SULOH|nr:hypothetical protein [Sulfurisphaera ohwakuensis]MBB5254515.1 YQGE family putative transporter [Sulfurisphaera ohwakuensis]QGR18125.1 hypothetical protein D1869_13695 [Sulfurisphaera ohwakuensis]